MSEFFYQPASQREAVAIGQESRLGIVRSVGDESLAVITRLEAKSSEADDVGNILRRTCQGIGKAACADGCGLLREQETAELSIAGIRYDRVQAARQASIRRRKLCADTNLLSGLKGLGISPNDTLMVAVTGDDVGFADQLEQYRLDGRVERNPHGWQEIKGFNAFFSHGDRQVKAPLEGYPAIGSRLADCAHLEFEFKDSMRRPIIGFEHGTRPNMFGSSKYAFEADGRPASYTEYILRTALEHYDADPTTVLLRLSSSIKPENFAKRFSSSEEMESVLPGWLDDGFVWNASDPNWQEGDEIREDDIWYADARGLILRDIDQTMERLGIPRSHFNCEDMLDPADTDGEFSSHQNRDRYGDTRDLYMVAHSSAFTPGIGGYDF